MQCDGDREGYREPALVRGSKENAEPFGREGLGVNEAMLTQGSCCTFVRTTA